MTEIDVDKFKLPLIMIAILLAISFVSVLPVLNMVILGAMFAYGIRPIANKIQTKAKYQSLSIFIATFLIIIPICIVLFYLFFEIIGAISGFLSAGGFTLNLDTNQTANILIQNLPVDMQSILQPYTDSINSQINNLMKWLLNYIIGLLKNLPNLIVQFFVLISAVYYFAKDGDKIWDYVFTFVPEDRTSFFDNMLDEVANVLKSIFYGHFLTAIIIGIIAGIGYALLGYSFAFFLGVLTAIFQLIPIFGPWPIYWALAIYDVLITGNITQAVLTVLFGFVLSLSDMYIRPALAGKYADIHPLILLIGFMAGPFVFGLIGLILGPLILGITYAVIKSVKEELEREKEGAVKEGLEREKEDIVKEGLEIEKDVTVKDGLEIQKEDK